MEGRVIEATKGCALGSLDAKKGAQAGGKGVSLNEKK